MIQRLFEEQNVTGIIYSRTFVAIFLILQERDSEDESAAGLQNAEYFLEGTFGMGHMLENITG